MTGTVYLACDPANVDATTGHCSAPYWVAQPSMLPPLDAVGGAAIGVAILLTWATAYSFRAIASAASRGS
ncbi:hypothetical protein EKH80_02865 [Dyella choica]|uniref:Uncharacterized protein n=1 Tax=Dyella choica TaxID=1927959 RepID=A0A3S0PPJ3_9GAMM|nr:hypothetical protein EKH80_02865 [Dyella choica]